MTIVDMLGQSAVLTFLGMGIVFSFLIIMIISISVVGKIIHALGADKDVLAPALAAVPKAAGTEAEVTAAIAAAVHEYRKEG